MLFGQKTAGRRFNCSRCRDNNHQIKWGWGGGGVNLRAREGLKPSGSCGSENSGSRPRIPLMPPAMPQMRVSGCRAQSKMESQSRWQHQHADCKTHSSQIRCIAALQLVVRKMVAAIGYNMQGPRCHGFDPIIAQETPLPCPRGGGYNPRERERDLLQVPHFFVRTLQPL